MAEIFGAVVGGITLCSQLTRCAFAIRQATKRIKNSRRDIADLSNETVIFAGLCENFLRTCADDNEARKSTASSISPLKVWLKRIRTDLSLILQKVEAIGASSGPRNSIESTLIAYLEWLFSKNAVKTLRASLTVARASISGFSNLMCISKLNKELQMLQFALENDVSRQRVEKGLGMKIEEKILSVEQSIEIHNSVHHTNKRMLKTAKKELQLKEEGSRTADKTLDKLLDLTESFEAYTKEVLPSAKSSHHQQSRYPSTSTSRSTLEQAFPERRRPGKSESKLSSHRTSTPRKAGTSPSPAAPSNVSISTRSSSSSQNSVAASNSTLNTSSVATQISDSAQNNNNVRSPNESTGVFVEHRDVRSREYINDPSGDILSRPKRKPLTDRTPSAMLQQVGRHTIMLNDTNVLIDKHVLTAERRAVAANFFQVLLQHKEKLDDLVEALAAEEGEESWYGLPGWVVKVHEVIQDTINLDIEEI